MYDVVVVGAGNAALVAAIAAAEAGARVVVLEKASEELRGGNTRFTGGVFRFVYERGADDLKPIVPNEDFSKYIIDPYTADQFLEDMRRVTGGKADTALVRVLVDRSYETVLWMKKMGVEFEFAREFAVPLADRAGVLRLPPGAAVRSVRAGLGLSDRLFDIVERLGIEIRYKTMALRPEFGERGEVVGLLVRTPALGTKLLPCRSVVLGCGGFQASPEMRVAYLGPVWGSAKVRGTRYDTGDMHRALLDMGAMPAGDWGRCHATPVDADSPEYGDLELTDKTNRLSYPYGIMVNLDGNRFVDEGEDLVFYTYAKMGGEILRQRSGIAFQIFDGKVTHLLEPRYSTARPLEAQTIEDLAMKISERYPELRFNVTQFIETVRLFNAATRPGSFDPSRLDGVRTEGISPPKSNWALPIDTPPFVAYAVTGGITFTFGGLAIDTEARVLDVMGQPIPGLYATGEITGGFFYYNYPGGAGLMRGAVFGRIAGANAAAYARG
jgi:tricarballylate dehydrogenase